MANREAQRAREAALAALGKTNRRGKKPSLAQQAEAARLLRGK